MTNKSLIFAGIFAAITTSSFATGENTVTSKSYVDAMDATKQDKITAKTTGNVVTYNGTDKNGQARFDERGIYDGVVDYTDNDADSLITAGAVQGQIDASVTNQITNVNNNIANVAAELSSQNVPNISVQLPLECANKECNLWTITGNSLVHRIQTCSSINDCPACETGFLKTCTGDKTKYCGCVYGGCNTVADCPACGTGTAAVCTNNVCSCQCKAINAICASDAECCSNNCADDGYSEVPTRRCQAAGGGNLEP
jgi:hypothetical protein